MALTESTSTRLEIAADGTVFVDTETDILRDGVKIASEVNRTGYHPGADVSSLPENIQAVCAAAWTPEVLAAWEQRINQAPAGSLA
jgi:hypothetical protein